jgi:hypothetical protein
MYFGFEKQKMFLLYPASILYKIKNISLLLVDFMNFNVSDFDPTGE